MQKLTTGRMTTKELAEWFGYSYGTFRRKKSQLMPLLSQYCTYELYHGYIEINEVDIEVYRGDLSKDVEEYKQQVEKAPLNSISNIAKQAQKKPQYNHLTKRQLERLMTKAGIIGFGVTADENSKGIHGSRSYLWSIKTNDPDHPYRNLTAEEQQIFNEYTMAIFKERPEVAQKMALLLDEFRHSDMTKEEFINHEDRLNFEGTFQDVIFKFREDTGLILVRATEHEFEEKSAF